MTEIPPEARPLIARIGAGFDPDKPTKAQRRARVDELVREEVVLAKQEAEWERSMLSYRGATGRLREVAPSDVCDRCSHPSRRHAAPSDWSVCSVREGTDANGKPVYCPCDGYFPKP